MFVVVYDRSLRNVLTEEVIRDLAGDTGAIEALEAEWRQLNDDRVGMREVFPKGDMRIVLPCKIERLIWNAKKIFRINARKQTDLNPLKVVEGVR